MDTKDILIAARELYASAPSHAMPYAMPPAGTYCMLTAVYRTNEGPAWTAYDALREAAGGNVSLVDFNAAHSTADVLVVYDKAIAETD